MFSWAGGEKAATVTEIQAGSAATLVYDGSGHSFVKEFTVSGLVEDALYAFKVLHIYPAVLVFVLHWVFRSLTG